MRVEGKADRTLVLYGQTVTFFSAWLAQRGQPAGVSSLDRDVDRRGFTVFGCMACRGISVTATGQRGGAAFGVGWAATQVGAPVASGAVGAVEETAMIDDERPDPAGDLGTTAGAVLPRGYPPSPIPGPAPAPRGKRRPWIFAVVAGVVAGVIVLTAAAIGITACSVTRPSPHGTAPTSATNSSSSTPAYRPQTVLPFTGLDLPNGVAVDSSGTVYVTDNTNSRVLKLAAGSNTQTELPWLGRFDWPGGVAVDTAGNAYVTDTGNSSVVKLTPGSSAPTVLPFTGLHNPGGVAVDTAGNVYVAENQDNRVQKLAAGSDAQTVLPFTGLNNPLRVAVDTAGTVYVTDFGNNRVLKLAAGSDAQTVLPFPRAVANVAVDSAGAVYVTKKNLVLKLAAGSNTPTELPFTDLDLPNSVAVDTAGNVYVTDGGHRVVKLPAG
jgi:serine/threonine protein kinase, bacterial